MEHFSPPFVFVLVVSGSFALGMGFACVYFLRHTIVELYVGREGMRVRTNNDAVQLEIAGQLDRIDSNCRKSIREATTELELLDTKKYGTATEVLTVNLVANLPLVYSSYENHHTRELSASGVDAYLGIKAREIRKAVKVWQNDVSGLTNKVINAYACLWVKEILIPNVRRACEEKVAYYKSLLIRRDIGESIKAQVKEWLKKHEGDKDTAGYLKDLDELANRSGIIQQSSIFSREEGL